MCGDTLSEQFNSVTFRDNSYKAERLAAAPINKTLRAIFIVAVLRPLFWLIFGFNRYDRLEVPKDGPFILAPNHNSHLDVLIIATLLPLKHSMKIKTAAAADYFWKFWLSRWFVFGLFGSIPVWRTKKGKKPNVIEALNSALDAGSPILIFPEGTRGKPEVLANLKRGVTMLAKKHPRIPIVPIYCSGAGKALPKGAKVVVPIRPKIIALDWIFAQGKSEDEVAEEMERAFFDTAKKISEETNKKQGKL